MTFSQCLFNPQSKSQNDLHRSLNWALSAALKTLGTWSRSFCCDHYQPCFHSSADFVPKNAFLQIVASKQISLCFLLPVVKFYRSRYHRLFYSRFALLTSPPRRTGADLQRSEFFRLALFVPFDTRPCHAMPVLACSKYIAQFLASAHFRPFSLAARTDLVLL